MGSLISEVVTDGVKALNTKEPVAPVGRSDKQVDGQAGRFERIFAAHTRAHAVDEMVSHLMSKKDTNGDGLAGRAELSIAARTHAAFNNMISEILPPEKASKLDATV